MVDEVVQPRRLILRPAAFGEFLDRTDDGPDFAVLLATLLDGQPAALLRPLSFELSAIFPRYSTACQKSIRCCT